MEGLQGGHSGAEIHKNRANANKVMGLLLSRIQEKMPICLTSLQGGAKDNVIPHTCEASLVVLGMHPDQINEIAAQVEQEVRSTYAEPNAVIRGDDVDALGGNAVPVEETSKIIALMNKLPNSVQTWSTDIEGLVQTSLNLGVASLNDELRLTFSVRSSVNREKEELLAVLQEIAEGFGARYVTDSAYPAWEYKKDSRLRDTMVQVYQQMYGKAPQVLAIHAGLECGLLSEKLPDLDCVSIGPDMQDIHTSREMLNIASTCRTWEFLLEVLKNL